jgi:hypothetical protein
VCQVGAGGETLHSSRRRELSWSPWLCCPSLSSTWFPAKQTSTKISEIAVLWVENCFHGFFSFEPHPLLYTSPQNIKVTVGDFLTWLPFLYMLLSIRSESLCMLRSAEDKTLPKPSLHGNPWWYLWSALRDPA